MRAKKLYPVRHICDFRDLLEQSEKHFSQKAAFWVRVKDGGFRSITYSHFKEDVDALGAALVSLGLRNDTTAVLGENRYE